MGKQKLDGLGTWPRTTGRHLEGNTMVLCTQLKCLGPQDTSVGYVVSSHQVGSVWKYQVAIPPFPRLREKWCLVGGVHPSQLTPVSLLAPETLDCVSSPALILDANYNSKLPMVKAPKTEIGSGGSRNGKHASPATVAAKRPPELSLLQIIELHQSPSRAAAASIQGAAAGRKGRMGRGSALQMSMKSQVERWRDGRCYV